MTLFESHTPYYEIDEQIIAYNLKKLAYIKEKTSCKILLATKAYSCFDTYPLLSQTLDGTTNSSVNETRLSYETFGKETHVYSPAYSHQSIEELINYADHIIFNSIQQFQTFKQKLPSKIQYGLRLNPEHIEVVNNLYSPCVPGSRFGMLTENLLNQNIDGISGFHIHALCQNNGESLIRLMKATERKFKNWLDDKHIKWVNFGGGHMIPHEKYNPDQVCEAINSFQSTYNVQVILEPGEAVVYKAGKLVCNILDIIHNTIDIAICNTSATAHMPDILEMPYTPTITHAYKPNEQPYRYRIAGNTCLSGDIMGEYSFKKPLQIGDNLTFEDMAQYTIVKNTWFNGIDLPSIIIKRLNGKKECVKQYSYTDFVHQLGKAIH